MLGVTATGVINPHSSQVGWFGLGSGPPSLVLITSRSTPASHDHDSTPLYYAFRPVRRSEKSDLTHTPLIPVPTSLSNEPVDATTHSLHIMTVTSPMGFLVLDFPQALVRKLFQFDGFDLCSGVPSHQGSYLQTVFSTIAARANPSFRGAPQP